MTNNTFNSEINNIKNDNHYEKRITQPTTNERTAGTSPIVRVCGKRTYVHPSLDLHQSSFGASNNTPPAQHGVG